MQEGTIYDYSEVLASSTPDTSTYVAPIYRQSNIISSWHNLARGGNTNEISYLASSETQGEYIAGTLIISIILLLSLIIWGGILIYLRCNDIDLPENARFLAGCRFETDLTSSLKPSKRPLYARLTFLFASLMIFIFTIVLSEKGLEDLQSAEDLVQAENLRIKLFLEDCDRVAITMIENGFPARALRDRILEELPEFCPKNNDTVLGFDFKVRLKDEYLDAIDALEDFYLDKWLLDAKESIDRLWNGTVTVNETIEDTNLGMIGWYWIPLVIFTSILVLGTIMAIIDTGEEACKYKSPERFQWFLKKIVLPLFIFWAVGSWLMAVVFAVVATMNADICAGGPSPGNPDNTMMDSLARNGYSTEGVFYKSLQYYVRGCTTEFFFTDILDYKFELVRAIGESKYILELVREYGTIEMSEDCKNDISDVMVAVDDLETLMQFLLIDTDRAIEEIRCERLNSIYAELFYKGTCQFTAHSLAWIFYSLVPISIFAMLMITLRSAVLPNFVWEEEEKEKRRSPVVRKQITYTTIAGPQQHLALPPSEGYSGHSKNDGAMPQLTQYPHASHGGGGNEGYSGENGHALARSPHDDPNVYLQEEAQPIQTNTTTTITTY